MSLIPEFSNFLVVYSKGDEELGSTGEGGTGAAEGILKPRKLYLFPFPFCISAEYRIKINTSGMKCIIISYFY